MIAPPWTPIPPLLYGGHRAGGRPAGPRAAGRRPRRAAVRHRRLHLPGAPPMGPPGGRGHPHRQCRARDPPRHPRLRGGPDCDVVHDHTMMGPFHSEHYPGLPVATTIHGPFNEELTDIYRANADRVPIVAISHAQRRAAPEIPIARVIHHGVDASHFPVGDGGGDEDGPYVLFLGRMAADKGAHRAIRGRPQGRDPHPDGGQDARALGDALLHRGGGAAARAGRPLPGRGVPRAQARAAGREPRPSSSPSAGTSPSAWS